MHVEQWVFAPFHDVFDLLILLESTLRDLCLTEGRNNLADRDGSSRDGATCIRVALHPPGKL